MILILTANVLSTGLLEATDYKSREPHDYLAIVRAYADVMIEHGRDEYGEKHSPLFTEELDRRTMRTLEGKSLKKVAAISRDEWGIRPHDRMLGGSNPQHCQNLYQILFQLTEITGEEHYAKEANRKAVPLGATVKTFALLLLPTIAGAHIIKSIIKMSSRIPYWRQALSDPKGIETAQRIVAAKLVLDKSVTNALDPAISFIAAAVLLVALAVTMQIFCRSVVMQKHSPGVKVVLLLSVLAYWSIFGLTIFGWRFG